MQQKSTFNRNFDRAIMELTHCSEDDIEHFRFELKPVFEAIGIESSKDDWMKNAVLANNNIELLQHYSDAIRILSAGNSHYPLWAVLSLLDDQTITIEFSTRFRHLKTSHHQETGHPPFKIIRADQDDNGPDNPG